MGDHVRGYFEGDGADGHGRPAAPYAEDGPPKKKGQEQDGPEEPGIMAAMAFGATGKYDRNSMVRWTRLPCCKHMLTCACGACMRGVHDDGSFLQRARGGPLQRKCVSCYSAACAMLPAARKSMTHFQA